MPCSSRLAASSFLENPARRELATSRVSITRFTPAFSSASISPASVVRS
jgi:hypothetical protein